MFKKFVLFLLSILIIPCISNSYFLPTPERYHTYSSSKTVELVESHGDYFYLIRPKTKDNINSYLLQKKDIDNKDVRSITISGKYTYLYLQKIKIINNVVYITGIAINEGYDPFRYYAVKISMGLNMENLSIKYMNNSISSAYINHVTVEIDDNGNLFSIYRLMWGNSSAVLVCKYDPYGSVGWLRSIPNAEEYDNVCSENGYLYIIGKGENDDNGHPKCFIAKFDGNGNMLKYTEYTTVFDNFLSYITVKDNKPIIAMASNAKICGSGNKVITIVLNDDFSKKYTYIFTRSAVCATYDIKLLKFEDDVYVIPVYESYLNSGDPDEMWIEIYALNTGFIYEYKRTQILPSINRQGGEWINKIAACLYLRNDVRLASMNNSISQKRLIVYQSEENDKLKIYDFWIPRKIEMTIELGLSELKSLPVEDFTRTPSALGNATVYKYEHGVLLQLGADDILFAGYAYYIEYFDFFGFENDFMVRGPEILSRSYGSNNKYYVGIGAGTYPGWITDGDGFFVQLVSDDDEHMGHFLVEDELTTPTYGYIVPPGNSGYYFEVDQTEALQ